MMENKFKASILLREIYRIEKSMDPEIYNTDESKIYELINEIQQIYNVDEEKIYRLIKQIEKNIDEELLNDQIELVSNIFDN